MKRIPVRRRAVLAAIAYLAYTAPLASDPLPSQVDQILPEASEVTAVEQLRIVHADRVARDHVNKSQQALPERQLLRLEESAGAMGTTYTVVVYGHQMVQMRSALDAAFGEVHRVDRMLSNYRTDGELADVNRYAAERPVRVTPELFTVLSECERYSRESEGTFDITVGPLIKVWGFYRGTGRLADKQEVARALEMVGYSKVVLDAADSTVRFVRPGVELDLGGIGKGYAVDRMVTMLKENGISIALVNGGGSSIYGLGAPPSQQRGWEINIRDPNSPSKVVAEVYLKNESISTSGSSEKFFMAEGRLYSHIMNPRTGYPGEGILEISVIAPKAVDSEAWTKPYFILGRQWAIQHKPKHFRVFLCEDRAEQQCGWLP